MQKRTVSILKHHFRQLISVPGYYVPYAFHKGRAGTPTCVDIELTYRCNMRCQMCPQVIYKNQHGGNPQDCQEEMSEQDLDRVFGDLAAMKVGYITLTGGEPLVRKDIFSIIQSARRHGLFVNILSNGALLDEAKAKELARLGVGCITFSLDGDQEIHDRVRGVKGTFSRLTRGIEALNQSRNGAGGPSLSLNCTISRLNQDNFSNVIGIASEMGITSVNYGFLFFTDEEAIRKTSQDVSLGAKDETQIIPDELKDVDHLQIEEEIARTNKLSKKLDIHVTFSPPLRGGNIHKYFSQIEYSYCGKCFFPWYSSRISPYGEVYPCSIDISIGNIRSTPFSELWNNSKYIHFRNTLKKKGLFAKCSKCCVLNTKLWDYLPQATNR